MFLLNSRLGLFSATPSGYWRKAFHPNGALLLPKLRSHFAEFLNRGSLARLRILSPAYLCRFAVRAPDASLEAFLDSAGTTSSATLISLPFTPQDYVLRICLQHSLHAWTGYSISLMVCLPVSPHCSNGILVVPEFQPVVHHLRLSASA